MKFNKQDAKPFVLGVAAGIAAVIIWDIIKANAKILNYKLKDKEL
jgi:multisubunit Na+/H+ antiporter MnhE subunit